MDEVGGRKDNLSCEIKVMSLKICAGEHFAIARQICDFWSCYNSEDCIADLAPA
jgi:hypothetical protein